MKLFGYGRVGRKSPISKVFTRKGAQMFSHLAQKTGGAMATTGAVMTATGIGAPAGAVIAGAGALVGGVGAITGGVEGLTRAKDVEDVVDSGGQVIKGAIGLRR